MPALTGLRGSWNTVNRAIRRVFLISKGLILSPLLGSLVGVIFITRLTGIFSGPDHYVIYFVGPLGGDGGLVNMENTFREAQSRMLNGVRVKFEQLDDSGDPAIASRIAMDLAAKSDTLMVVGHVLSSTSKAALPIYMRSRPQIPVILTTETTPNILPSSTDPDEEFPVYRLSPTDDDQAQSAYDFAKSRHGKKFWVVEDLNNAVYASYLAHKFLEQAQRESTRVLLLSTSTNPPSGQTIQQLGVQWVFFAGDWRGALMLIREMKALHVPNVKFILSDGCAGKELLMNSGSDLEGVYLTHQLKAAVFNKNGYGIYASNAIEIIDRLLKKSDQRFVELARQEAGLPYEFRRLLNMHRVTDARRVLIKSMNRSMASPFRLSTGEVFRFRKDATREDARFNVWQIQNRTFVDIGEGAEELQPGRTVAHSRRREPPVERVMATSFR